MTDNMTNPSVYIERALVNPVGADVGDEAVVIGNTTSAAVPVQGWSIADTNGKTDVITAAMIEAGASLIIKLTGEGARLGNKGGSISLMNAAQEHVHTVNYSAGDVQERGRYIRFNV